MPQEFYPFNLYQRYNGVFFIKNTGRKPMENKEVAISRIISFIPVKRKTERKQNGRNTGTYAKSQFLSKHTVTKGEEN